MKKITFAMMGLGNRGGVYTRTMLESPEKAEIVAIADPRETCRITYNEMLHLPENRVFSSGDRTVQNLVLEERTGQIGISPFPVDRIVNVLWKYISADIAGHFVYISLQ